MQWLIALVSYCVLVLAQPSTVTKKRILFIGDSQACGVAQIASKIHPQNLDVHIECKNGTTANYWNNGALKLALQHYPNPDNIVVFLGTNHYLDTSKKPIAGMSSLLKTIQDLNSKCIWVGNTSVHGKHWVINDVLRESVSPMCRYVDIENKIELVDGIHPTKTGVEKLLNIVWKLL